MQQDICSAIHQSVTSFVETPHGRALAHRGRRGELRPGEFFAAACASAQSAVLEHVTGSMAALPDNLEQAYLQAWALADGSERHFDLDWRLDDARLAEGIEVRYRLELDQDCVRLIVGSLTEAPTSV